uniref:CSON011530 protein n=1 Tax=Culicoides sonorensis TaxID=179676 RepID=A0A336M3H4_CULSO
MIRREVKKVKPTHYVATHGRLTPSFMMDSPSLYRHTRGYSTDGEGSQKALSEKTISEYVVATEKRRKPRKDIEGLRPYRPPSVASHRSHSRPRSVISMAESRASTLKSAKSAKSKVIITSVPNPFCPKIKGMCCLMLLLNLGLILVTLGLVIVVQFFEPIFVWILGIIFLVFGFVTIFGCIIYCAMLCRKHRDEQKRKDLIWTTHYQKNIRYLPNTIDYHKNYLDPRLYEGRYSASRNSGAYSSDVESNRRY